MKNTKDYWDKLVGNYVELRELEVENFDSPSKYSFFMKQKSLYESLYGDFVLKIQGDWDTHWVMMKKVHISLFIKCSNNVFRLPSAI